MNQKNRRYVYAAVVAGVLLFGYLALFVPSSGSTQTGMNVGGTLTIDYGDGTKVTMVSKNMDDRSWWQKLTGLDVLSVNGKTFNTNSMITLGTSILWDVQPANKDGTPRSSNVQYWVNNYITIDGVFSNGLRSYDPFTGNPGTQTASGLFHTTELSHFTGTESTNWMNYMANTNLVGGYIENYYAEKGSGLQVGQMNWGVPTLKMAKPIEDATKGVPLVGDASQIATTALGHVQVRGGQKETLFGYTKPVYELHIDLGRINWQGLSMNAGSFTVGAGTWTRLAVGDTYTLHYRMSYVYRYQDVTGAWSDWKGNDVELFSFTTTVQSGNYQTVNLNPSGGFSFFG